MCPRFPTHLPLPLISLRLASDNLLDSVLTDARGVPAFVLETERNITTLSRCDPAHGSSQAAASASASIEWPLALPSSPKSKVPVPNVSIDGRTEPSDLLLKKSVMGNSRKFHLPGSPGSLKWKRVADHYQCTLCTLACTCHTAVATLHPSSSTAPGELSIYAPVLPAAAAAAAADTRPSQNSAVSLRLLEYLIITSVLLTTAYDDWRRFPNTPDFSSPPPPSLRLSLRQTLSPPSSPTISLSTTFSSPIRRKLDLLEGDSDPFYPSSPTSTHTRSDYTTRSLTRSRSSNYLRPTIPIHTTPFSTPPSTPPIAYHDLPTIALPVRALPAVPAPAPSPDTRHALPKQQQQQQQQHVAAPAPQYSPRSQLQTQSRTQHLAPPPRTPEEAPPSYAEIEWTIKVPQRRVSRRELDLFA